MLRRPHRINFRLSRDEYAEFNPLITQLHAWDWSNLCRMALRKLYLSTVKDTSDNYVRQDPPAASDKRSSVRQPKKRHERKKNAPQKKRQKV